MTNQLLTRWAADLAAWRIPEPITGMVDESPWILPTEVFSRRADRHDIGPHEHTICRRHDLPCAGPAVCITRDFRAYRLRAPC